MPLCDLRVRSEYVHVYICTRRFENNVYDNTESVAAAHVVVTSPVDNDTRRRAAGHVRARRYERVLYT